MTVVYYLLNSETNKLDMDLLVSNVGTLDNANIKNICLWIDSILWLQLRTIP